MTVHFTHRQGTKQCNQRHPKLKTVPSCFIRYSSDKCFTLSPSLSIPNLVPVHLHQMLSSSSTTTTTTTCTCNRNNNLSSNKSMEDVWDSIKLTSLSDHNTTHISKATKFQDFLARPFNSFAVDPSPVTALTLSTRSEYPPPHKDLRLLHTAPKTEPFADPLSNKRAPPASRDMRHARLMKNRESAARSRARKQENIAFSLSSVTKIHSFRFSAFFA